jgi:TolB protein
MSANKKKSGMPQPQYHQARRLLLILVLGAALVASVVAWPIVQARMLSPEVTTPVVPTGTATPSPSPTATPEPSQTALPSPTAGQPVLAASLPTPLDQGSIVLAVRENGFSHLFLYRPQIQPLTRLTWGAWDDITPAISPDGSQIAFSSNRDGQWDLYLLDISSGELKRVTDTPTYDASPSFSPDGRWLAYETLVDEDGGGLEIYIRSMDNQQDPIRLTNDPAADYSPAWSPKGRQIAFVSNRGGDADIWLADLDQVDNRFQNLSRSQDSNEDHPTWSPDGASLAWASSSSEGVQSVFVWDGSHARYSGSGCWPAWSPDGNELLAGLQTPNQTYLTGYDRWRLGLILPPLALSGALKGLDWGNDQFPDPLPASFEQASQATPGALWQPALTPLADVPNGRQRVVSLDGVEAPNPMLNDLVDESFQALRKRVAAEAGWDFLSNLENAFVPLTAPLAPGMGEDWLYTGRAFAFNTLPVNAGWVMVVREDLGSQAYWRVYLRTRFQDGSQGEPLHSQPWNFSARFSGDVRSYEQGGALLQTVPTGYWLDFTALAAAYGWERLPALNTWRSAVATSHFNEFVLSDQQDWRDAMLELYPGEVLITPTAVIPTTQLPTRTPRPTRTPTPTRRPYSTRTPSPTP